MDSLPSTASQWLLSARKRHRLSHSLLISKRWLSLIRQQPLPQLLHCKANPRELQALQDWSQPMWNENRAVAEHRGAAEPAERAASCTSPQVGQVCVGQQCTSHTLKVFSAGLWQPGSSHPMLLFILAAGCCCSLLVALILQIT